MVAPLRRILVVASLLILWLSSPSLAGPREAIEASYRSIHSALALKYRYGLTSHRTAQFTSYDLDGLVVSPEAEQRSIDALFERALTLEESGNILIFQQIGPELVECEVVDTIKASIVADDQKRTKASLTIFSRSRDQWKLTSAGWRQSESRLLEQQVTHVNDPEARP